LEKSLAINKGLGDRQAESALVHELARVESGEGNPAEARRLLQRSLAISEDLNDLPGQASSLHALAGAESILGNSVEARRLLQRSLALKEAVGDLLGQAASLGVLASIDFKQGDRAEARRLWERSLALYDQLGEVEGRVTVLMMVAVLEAVEGNLEKALPVAPESVQLLESIASAKAAAARESLLRLELATGGPALVPVFEAAVRALLKQATDAGPEGELAGIDAALNEARGSGPTWEVVALLARSVVCWKSGHADGCDQDLQQAEDVLERVDEVHRAALATVVENFKNERAQATPRSPSESDRLYEDATAKAQAGESEGALALFEGSLTASRQEGDIHGVAVNLLMIGQILLALGRVGDARDRLRHGLEVASEIGDEALLKDMQKLATAAAALESGAVADRSARRGDKGQEETGRIDDAPGR
jgi:tetratricopeptide (TPR) repeat protein